MNKNKPALWPVLVLPALCAFSATDETFASTPQEGIAVRKSYTQDSQVSMEESTMSVNGSEQEFDMEITMAVSQTYVFVDRYVAVDEFQVTKLERTYEELSSSTERSMVAPVVGESTSTSVGESELEGATVLFEWDEDEDGYLASFAEDAGLDDELLEGLSAGLDFAAFLPEEDVSAGSTWEVDPEVFRDCYAPGGALKIEMETDGEAGTGAPEPPPDMVIGDLEGEVTAEFVGIEDEDGTRVAVIRLTLTVASAQDLTGLMLEMMEDADGPEGMQMEVEAFDMEFEFDGEGEIRWNLETGMLYSLELSGEQTSTMDTAMSMSMGSRNMEVETSMTLAGAIKIRVETELAD